MKRFAKSCLLTFGVIILLALSCCFYIRRPRFSRSSPVTIEVICQSDDSSSVEYQLAITNQVACNTIIRTLSDAHFVGFGGKSRSWLLIHYVSGKTDCVVFAEGRRS